MIFELKYLMPVEQLYIFSSGAFLGTAIFGPGTLNIDAMNALKVTLRCYHHRVGG